VTLDAGHGGEDRGASRGDINEAAITLSVVKQVANALKSEPDIKVSFTRTDDTYCSLEDRVQIVNREHPDVFISIHVNSSKDASARGQEIYFQNQLDADDEALFLANLENDNPKREANPTGRKAGAESVPRVATFGEKTIRNPDVKAIVEDLERNFRLRMSGVLTEKLHENWAGDSVIRKHSIRQAPFYVISNVHSPAALVEIGYLTNPSEARRLIDPAYQKKIARGIADAVMKYKEVIDKRTKQHLN
jgi:N-acetylmuramoyl-L-alanine amidase